MSMRDQLMYKISLYNCHFSQVGDTVNKEGVILQRSQMAAEATSGTELFVILLWYLLVTICTWLDWFSQTILKLGELNNQPFHEFIYFCALIERFNPLKYTKMSTWNTKNKQDNITIILIIDLLLSVTSYWEMQLNRRLNTTHQQEVCDILVDFDHLWTSYSGHRMFLQIWNAYVG